MREFSRNLRESGKSIARRGTAECVRRNIKPLQILVAWLDLLKDTRILPQILQVLRGFLEEHLDAFAVNRAHARPSVTSSGFCSSSAVGLRYRMQSFKTIAWNFTAIFEIDSECPRKR